MQKTRELPFYESYGFGGETPFRYFFLKEDSNNLENYKEAIIKCLKYDILYHIFPDYESGHETYDALRPPVTNPVQLNHNTFARVFHESVRGTQSGEIVVTYKLSEDRKSVELTLYDRDTILQPVQVSLDEDAPLQYAIVDKVIESKLKITKGKKISKKDIQVYKAPVRKALINEEEHSYDAAMKVIKTVKSKLTYPLEDPRDLLVEGKEKKNTSVKKG